MNPNCREKYRQHWLAPSRYANKQNPIDIRNPPFTGRELVKKPSQASERHAVRIDDIRLSLRRLVSGLLAAQTGRERPPAARLSLGEQGKP